ncbi:MAG: HAD family acid phosphatase [Vicinamibacterales bacterium]
MSNFRIGVALLGLALGTVPLAAQAPALQPAALEIKYVRDSQEYQMLSRMVYRAATQAVVASAKALAPKSWVVVLDLDETALDNSPFQLERAAYGIPFSPDAFVSWSLRREAGAVPGVVEFIDAVRRSGGRVAWISNRAFAADQATRDNLAHLKLWNDEDRICLQEAAERTKRVRRTEVIGGKGACSWNAPMTPVAFIGDQMGDFPAADEGITAAGTQDSFGTINFILPNPMYGDWTSRVTRIR